MKKQLLGIVLSGALAALIGTSSVARADTLTFDLTSLNIAGTGPFAQVTVDRTSNTTANITFNAYDGSGYLLMDGSSADVNVNATTWTITNFSATQLAGFNAVTLSDGGSSNVDGWGVFNQTVDSSNGFASASDIISFTLTNTSGIWATVADVLTGNSQGWLAAAHIAICNTNPCTKGGGASATGFAAGPGAIPIPPAFGLLLSGLAGLGFLGRRRRAKQEA